MSEDRTRAGFVAVIGAPNAGKSTLVNALVGQKVAIVSPKAQTTRARLMGIAIEGEAQILLVDTPGIFEPKRRLDRAMVAAAWTGAEDADLILLGDRCAAGVKVARSSASSRSLSERQHPLFLVLNKIDLVKKAELLGLSPASTARLNPDKVFMISAAQRRRRRRPQARARRGDARRTLALSRGRGVRRDRPDDRGRTDPRADRQPAPPGAALRDRDRDRDVGRPPRRLDRDPPADPGRARQPEGDRDRQGRHGA